jgi:hypothetical protein
MNSKDAIKKIMSILNLTENKFYDAKTDQGINVKMEGDSLEVGKTLYVATDEGMIPAPAGTHKMEDGSEVQVGDEGKVEKIKMSQLTYGKETEDETEDAKQQAKTANKPAAMSESEEQKVEMQDGDIKLKSGDVFRIGGETPEAGTKVKKVGYDGTLSAIADGAYETADGKVMQIVGGEIQGIQSKKAEDARGGKFTQATAKDGMVLDSPSFDIGEDVTTKDEKGNDAPVPDGEYQIVLTDEEGNDDNFVITVKDGKIAERETLDEAKSEDEDEMSGFVEAFATAMKRLETKIDSITAKQELLETKFTKFSKEPAGSRVGTKTQINQEQFSTSPKLEGWRKLREQISK